MTETISVDPQAANQHFDVFLSHNSNDKPAVITLAEALKSRDLRPWLDIWDLPPGRPWQEELEKILKTIPAAAVLVGHDGLGPWENTEMRALLSECAEQDLPVIPVLLPGATAQPRLPIVHNLYAKPIMDIKPL